MEHVPLTDLPKSWQREIKELRAENSRLRIRSREMRLKLEDLQSDGTWSANDA